MARACRIELALTMYKQTKLLKKDKVGIALAVMLLAGLAQGVSTAKAQPVEVRPAPPAVVAPGVVEQDTYAYYPRYGVYYNRKHHQYVYQRGERWVVAPTLEGVTPEVLMASPSVEMDFHDSPERHHAEVIRKYPKDWAPEGDRHEHHEHHDHDDGR